MRETAVDTRVIVATVKIEVCKKVETKYRLSPQDSHSTIYARALEDATRDVQLTEDDYKTIAAEIAQNRAKRQAKRNNRKGV